jgi:glycosyltransferase involved in cell wall biosynthesis
MLSIAMATFNGEKYIREQIDSILQQTYQDFELIICDDCSTDSTLNILNEYKQIDKRILIYQNEKNIGFKMNFQKAIRLCCGEFIALSDQDDIWYPCHLAVLYENIGRNSLICSNSLLVNDRNEILGKTMYDIKALSNLPDNVKSISSYLLYNNFVQGSSSLFKKELLNTAYPFPSTIDFHDHWLALNAMMTGGVVYLNIITLNYRQHNNNITQKQLKKSKYFIRDVFIGRRRSLSFLLSLRERHLMSDHWKIQLLNDAIKFYKSREKSAIPIYACFFFIKNYKKMYAQNNYHFFFIRLIKMLVHVG